MDLKKKEKCIEGNINKGFHNKNKTICRELINIMSFFDKEIDRDSAVSINDTRI